MSSPLSFIHSDQSDAVPRGIYSINTGRPFATDLASGLLYLMPDRNVLATAHILVPSRRAVQALTAAFLDLADNQPLILPTISALGDVDEFSPGTLAHYGADMPPAMDKIERQLILSPLIQRLQIGGRAVSPSEAIRLSISLCALLDQVNQSSGSVERLGEVLHDNFATHWGNIKTFLDIVFQRWPDIAAERHLMDPCMRAMGLLSAQCKDWQQNPPEHPVIIAGSTGSLPSTRALMKVVTGLPQGMIVLPGFPDTYLSEDDCLAIRTDIGHPLHQLLETLEALDVLSGTVQCWVHQPKSQSSDKDDYVAQRRALFLEVFRPAEQSYLWRRLAETHTHITRNALSSVRQIQAADLFQEADIIACLMREILEYPEKTAILVTADRTLARHVRAALMRWDIKIDDSAGVPLNETITGHYLQLIVEWAQSGGSAQALLALVKHPLASGGMQTSIFRKHVRDIEQQALRGYLPDSSAEGIAEKLKNFPELLHIYQFHILAPLAPVMEAFRHPTPDMGMLADAHSQAAENLAQTDIENRAILELWGSPSGKEAAGLLEKLTHFGAHMSLSALDYPAAFLAMTKQSTVRSVYSTNRRLGILGTIEARMQSADLVILGGLNEGVWPPHIAPDPWTNASMRKALGLPDRRWRTGLSAHDFFMNVCAPEIVMTRAIRVDDVLTTPSRWLKRLSTVLKAIGLEKALATDVPDGVGAIMAAQRAIIPKPCDMPAPRPVLSLRPRSFSATDFDKWITDPYQIYARKILKLRRLDPVDKRPDSALKGMLFHDVFAQFSKRHDNGPLPESAFENLMDEARRLFKPYLRHPQISVFWFSRFQSIASWFIETETLRRADVSYTLIEKRGHITSQSEAGPFELSATADRLDFHTDGSWTIIDYKTGATPSKTKVKDGRATQLLVEAVIAASGGYDETEGRLVKTTGNPPIRALDYWQLSGKRDSAVELTSVLPANFNFASCLLELQRLVSAFDDEDQAYLSEPDPAHRPRFSDYRHLARVKEWRPEEGSDD